MEEEVPPSPEVIAKRKSRRRGLSFNRKSLLLGATDEDDDPMAVNRLEPRAENVQRFYFDDNTVQVETVVGDPLASAALLERANQVLHRPRVPSDEFLSKVNDSFVTVGDLLPVAKPTEEDRVPRQHSYTQLDLDTQMIGICEAADILAGLDTMRQHEWQSPSKPVVEVLVESKRETTPVRLNSDEEMPEVLPVVLPLCTEATVVERILYDFTSNPPEDVAIDYSRIRCGTLQRRLRHLQSLIDSPPLAVDRTKIRRTFSNDRQARVQVARRLSYASENTTTTIDQVTTDDDEEYENSNGSDDAPSLDGVELNQSLLIQANLSQLSAFFSQPGENSARQEEPFHEQTRTPDSLNDEPLFYGFTPEPGSPISLPTDEPLSPKTLQADFSVTYEPSEWQPSEDEATLTDAVAFDQLLEEDSDLFLLAHPTQRKTVTATQEEECALTEALDRAEVHPQARLPAVVNSSCGFSTAAGAKLTVSVDALARARDMFAQVEADMQVAPLNWDGETHSNPPLPAVGFSTAGGSKIAISEQALARARHIFAQEEANIAPSGDASIKCPPEECTGFRSAGGNAIRVSAAALANAQRMFAEDAQLESPVLAGFQTARGTSIAISKEALAKAQAFMSELESGAETAIKLEPEKDLQQTKRKAFVEEADDLETPSKRIKLQVANHATTSTPTVSANREQRKAYVGAMNATKDIEQFFSELDDAEFQQLFCDNTSKPRVQPLRQIQLATKFEANTNESQFGVAKLESGCLPAVQLSAEMCRLRAEALEKQRHAISSKPAERRKQRVSDFCRRKLQQGRPSVVQFVQGVHPRASERQGSWRAVTPETATTFEFNMVEFYGLPLCCTNVTGVPIGDHGGDTLFMNDRSRVGLPEMESAFLAATGIDPSLVPAGWVRNAWKWIIVKLSSLERNFSEPFRGALSPENTFLQLQYRYCVEIDNARRSAVRRIVEKDDGGNRRMVLFVSRVFQSEEPLRTELELCDGWYAVRATLDGPLTHAVAGGKITVGTKLMIQGAEMVNHENACSPLEIPSGVRLKLHANSTRRARWMVKLGYYRAPGSFLISCNSINECGGLICRLQTVVVRVYPMMYVDKSQRTLRGSVLRSEKVQRRQTLQHDANQFDNLQMLFSQVQKELESEKESRTLLGRRAKVTESTSAAELEDMLQSGLDLSSLEVELSSTQRELIINFQQRQQHNYQEEINRRVKERLAKQPAKRSATPLLKVRLMDARKPGKTLMLSVWRPHDEVCQLLAEQNVIEMRNVSANGSRNSDLQLTAGKSSTFELLKRESFVIPRDVFRTVTLIGNIDKVQFRPPFNEFDTIGIVVHIGDPGQRKFQPVYLASTAMELLCVNFWCGVTEYAYEDVVKEFAVLCVANLQWRTGTTSNAVPCSFATEYTTFSEICRMPHFAVELEGFHQRLTAVDRASFIERCKEKVDTLMDHRLQKSIGTPIRTTDTIVRQQAGTPGDFSPGVGQPMSLTKRKIDKLALLYRSPPKLSPLAMRLNPVVKRGFKVPARLEDRMDADSLNDAAT